MPRIVVASRGLLAANQYTVLLTNDHGVNLVVVESGTLRDVDKMLDKLQNLIADVRISYPAFYPKNVMSRRTITWTDADVAAAKKRDDYANKVQTTSFPPANENQTWAIGRNPAAADIDSEMMQDLLLMKDTVNDPERLTAYVTRLGPLTVSRIVKAFAGFGQEYNNVATKLAQEVEAANVRRRDWYKRQDRYKAAMERAKVQEMRLREKAAKINAEIEQQIKQEYAAAEQFAKS